MHVFICSNSWLDVGYGAWLQAFFLRQAPLHLVVDNHAKRSFARADINTIITVAGAPRRQGKVPHNHIVRFVAFKKPFEDVLISENLLDMEEADDSRKTDAFRVYPVTAGELLQEGSESTDMGTGKYVGDKWGGKYLRVHLAHYKVPKSIIFVDALPLTGAGKVDKQRLVEEFGGSRGAFRRSSKGDR